VEEFIMKTLDTLQFSDLYVCLDGTAKAHYCTSAHTPGKTMNLPVGPDYVDAIKQLTDHILAEKHTDRSMIVFNGMRLRLAFMNVSNGEKWAALRMVKARPPALDKIGFLPALVPHLQRLGGIGGLVLICGATGQGKTTTSCSLLIDYMQRFGGVAYTIEDPVEYDLNGRHGDGGYCYQVEVRRDQEWAEGLVNALRCHPRYLFIGEVCTPDIANQVLRAATSGHIVIATIHAGNVFEGIEGILQLAEQKIGERARHLLASGFLAAIYQSIDQNGIRGFNARCLVTDGAGSQSISIRNLIRDNKIGQLASIMDAQHAVLKQTGQLFK
jgi:twitching motility protein PilT